MRTEYIDTPQFRVQEKFGRFFIQRLAVVRETTGFLWWKKTRSTKEWMRVSIWGNATKNFEFMATHLKSLDSAYAVINGYTTPPKHHYPMGHDKSVEVNDKKRQDFIEELNDINHPPDVQAEVHKKIDDYHKFRERANKFIDEKFQTKINKLDKELNAKIVECDNLHNELIKRPFEVKSGAETVNVSQHPLVTNQIQYKLKNNERFGATVTIEGEVLCCIVIGRSDSHNANFDNSEEGEIFVGVLDDEPMRSNLKFNDLIEFQSCDVHDIYDFNH